MPEYRRIQHPGGSFFFTLVTYQRLPIFREDFPHKILREAILVSMEKVGPFHIDAFCLLPDHLHCIWTLPEGDSDYSNRWRVIKAWFSHEYLQQGCTNGQLTASKLQKGEAGVWQRRFWEHQIRNIDDWNRHVNYIHYNPVKHGLVQFVKEWPWSTFHQFVDKGNYDEDWGTADPNINGLTVGE